MIVINWCLTVQGDSSCWVLDSVAINFGNSPAYGPLLHLDTAQAVQGNSPNWLVLNLGLNVMCHPVYVHSFNTFLLSKLLSVAWAKVVWVDVLLTFSHLHNFYGFVALVLKCLNMNCDEWLQRKKLSLTNIFVRSSFTISKTLLMDRAMYTGKISKLINEPIWKEYLHNDNNIFDDCIEIIIDLQSVCTRGFE